MRNILKKKITKGFLLFLFTFFSVGVQGQYDEYGGGSGECNITDAMKAGPFVNGVNAYGIHREYTGNIGEISWEEDPNDPNYVIPVFNIVPQYEYTCTSSGWDSSGGHGPLTGGGSNSGGSGGGGSGGGGTGGGFGTGAAAPPTPPAECVVLVCSGLPIDKPYLAPNLDTCKCDKLPRPWYPDFDGDGYHAGLPYFDVFWSIESLGIYWKKTTLGEDCDDDDSLVTTTCYKEWFRDNDGDNYEGATEYSAQKPISLGKWFEGKSFGIDCDDNNINVYKLNKCSKCDVEPVNGICGEDCIITSDDVFNTFGGKKSIIDPMINTINKYAKLLGINDKVELQHFLAQSALESKNFTSTEEGTKYQTKSVMSNFGKFFNGIGNDNKNPELKNLSDFGVIINSQGKSYIQNREALFNYIYNDQNRIRVGYSPIGNTQSGDGYKFIGRGIIQITGRDNYTNFNNWYKSNIDPNADLVNNPKLLDTNKEIGTLASLWYFKERVMDRLGGITEKTTVNQVTKKINSKMLEKKKRSDNFILAKEKINCKN